MATASRNIPERGRIYEYTHTSFKFGELPELAKAGWRAVCPYDNNGELHLLLERPVGSSVTLLIDAAVNTAIENERSRVSEIAEEQIQSAVAAERERCAKIAEDYSNACSTKGKNDMANAAGWVAKLIRGDSKLSDSPAADKSPVSPNLSVAGEDLDCAVINRVMGVNVTKAIDPGRLVYKDGGTCKFFPSTDIRHAMQVIEHLERSGFRCLFWSDDCGYTGRFTLKQPESEILHEATAKTFPLAICLAALKAVEKENVNAK